MNQKNIIACSSDNNYFTHLIVFLKSLRQYSDTHVWVRCINMSEDNVNYLKQFNNVTCVRDDTQLSSKRTIMSRGIDGAHPRMNSLRSRLSSPLHCYCAHSKFFNVNRLLKSDVECILSMDVDAIVRGDIDMLFQIYKNNEFVIDYDQRSSCDLLPSKYPVFKEGVMLVRNTHTMRVLFRYMNNKLLYLSKTKSPQYDIDSDHEELGFVYCELSERHMLSATKLNKDMYKDTNFTCDSIIWSGKGDRKDTNELYLKEFNRIKSIA